MKLYFLPGACSLAPHIALEWIGQPYEAERMTHSRLKEPEFLRISPLGAVPAIDDGGFHLSQNVAILDYLNDRYPQAALFGGDDPRQKAEARRWLLFFNADMHKAFTLVFAPAKFTDSDAAQAELVSHATAMLRGWFALANSGLQGRDYLTNAKPTVADAYLYVLLRWAGAKQIDLTGLDNLPKFAARMAANAGVQAALKAEGLTA